MGRRRDLASLQLLIQTLGTKEAQAARNEELEIQRKRLQLEIGQMKQAASAQTAQLRLQQAELALRSENQRVQSKVQLAQIRAGLAKDKQNMSVQLAQLELAMKGQALEMERFKAQLGETKRHNLSMEDFQRNTQVLQASQAMAEIMSNLGRERDRMREAEQVTSEQLLQSFGYIDPKTQEFVLNSSYQGLGADYAKGKGIFGATDREIAQDWADQISNNYDRLARAEVDAIRKANPSSEIKNISNLPPATRNKLSKKAFSLAMGSHGSDGKGILMYAVEGSIGHKKAREIWDASENDYDYYRGLMSFIGPSNKHGAFNIRERPVMGSDKNPLINAAPSVERAYGVSAGIMNEFMPRFIEYGNFVSNADAMIRMALPTMMIDLDNERAKLTGSEPNLEKHSQLLVDYQDTDNDVMDLASKFMGGMTDLRIDKQGLPPAESTVPEALQAVEQPQKDGAGMPVAPESAAQDTTRPAWQWAVPGVNLFSAVSEATGG